MREVRGEEFVHYQSDPKPYWQGVGVTSWRTGETHVVRSTFNPYFNFFNRNWGDRPGVTVGRNAIKSLEESLLPDSQQHTECCKTALAHLKSTVSDLHKMGDLVKELVFEDVRKNHFPTYPSRQRCIWVLPATREAVQFWTDRVPGAKHWFRVRLSGKIHTASDAYLKSDTMSLRQLEQLAWMYWSGFRGENENQDEVLFEGVVEVLEEVSIEALGG